MHTIAAFPLPNSPSTPQASVASMIATSTPSMGNLPQTQVAAAIEYQELRDYPESDRNFRRRDQNEEEDGAVSADDTFSLRAGPLQYGGIKSFPSLFLAQLLSQDMDDNARGLVASYEALNIKPGAPQPPNASAARANRSNPPLYGNGERDVISPVYAGRAYHVAESRIGAMTAPRGAPELMG